MTSQEWGNDLEDKVRFKTKVFFTAIKRSFDKEQKLGKLRYIKNYCKDAQELFEVLTSQVKMEIGKDGREIFHADDNGKLIMRQPSLFDKMLAREQIANRRGMAKELGEY
ncbi:MAG: DUF4897 domain-containing protein [Firmicutes bacterium]|nr:DUF4897 domain-containing protein [Bacillota bacterium]